MEQSGKDQQNKQTDASQEEPPVKMNGEFRSMTEKEFQDFLKPPESDASGYIPMGGLMKAHNERIKRHTASVFKIWRETKSN